MRPELRIPLIYLLVCVVYILTSDLLLLQFAKSGDEITQLQTFKGLFFVLASAILIYLLVRRGFSRIKEANHHLSETISYHQMMFDKCPLPAFIIDKATLRYLKVNEAASVKFGRSMEEYLQHTPMDYYPSASRDDFEQLALQIGKTGYMEFLIDERGKDGSIINQNLFCQNFIYEQSETLLFISHDVSITHESEVYVMDRMLGILEEERTRISRELHDGITQYFGMANGIAKSVQESLAQPKAGINLAEGIKRLVELTSRGANESRSMSHALNPSSGNNLVSLLKDLIGNMNYVKKIDFRLEAAVEHTYSTATVLNLFRIAQESIRNIVTHSKASKATIHVFEKSRFLYLEISDNGQGFDITVSPHTLGSIGLKTIRTRALKLGGSFRITSEPGFGTTLRVKIPMKGNIEPIDEELLVHSVIG